MNLLDMYAGVEDLELGAAAGDVVEAVEEAVKTEVAEVAVVIEEQSNQIEQLVEQVTDLEEAVEEAVEVVDGLESLLGSGNFNSVAFSQLYNRGVKLANKLGGNIQGDRMGAESISDAATAQLMARTGMESIMDTIKEYGRKAIEFIKHIFNTVINFFVSIFNQADGVVRRTEQLRKRLNDGAKIKEQVKLGGWNVYFDYAKNGLSGSSKAKPWDATQDAVAALATLGNNVSGITLEGFKSAYASVISAIKSDAKAAGKYNEKKSGNTDVLISIDAGIRVQASFADNEIKDLGDAATHARSLKIVIMKDPEAKKLSSGETKAKLDKSALLGILDHNKAAANGTRGDKVAKKFTNAERDRVVGSLNAIKASDSDKTAEINKQVTLVKAIFASAASVTQAVSKHTMSTLKASCDGVAAHLSF
jgi:hypothetical protein